TQSLVIRLQSTPKPQTGKAPIVIPGSRRPTTEKLPAHRSLHPSVRLGSLLIVTLSILLFTLFSLAPLGSSQSNLPLFNGAIQWAEQQQVTWNGIVTRIKQAGQAPVANTTPPTPPTPPTTTNPPPAPNLPRGAYVDVARQAAIRYGINPDSFVRQIQQESHFDPNAQSPSGAVGIAQFIPSTAASIGVNPYDPVSALNGAARLMSSLASQFGGDYAKALAAYNAGPGAVQNAVNVGGAGWLAYVPPETQNYVRTIMG
nr:lytic transglycosylase domain-containing protein [Ktedonobacteraceae bacterium]